MLLCQGGEEAKRAIATRGGSGVGGDEKKF